MIKRKSFNTTKYVKSYVDNNFDPAKVCVIDPIKDNHTQLLCIIEILDNLEIPTDNYREPCQCQKSIMLSCI